MVSSGAEPLSGVALPDDVDLLLDNGDALLDGSDLPNFPLSGDCGGWPFLIGGVFLQALGSIGPVFMPTSKASTDAEEIDGGVNGGGVSPIVQEERGGGEEPGDENNA